MKNPFSQMAEFFGGPLFRSKKYFGKYRGTVLKNHDPQSSGQIHIQLPTLPNPQKSHWAVPCLPLLNTGLKPPLSMPDVGDSVWIEFEEGDLGKPLWVGNAGDVSKIPDLIEEPEPPASTRPEPACCKYIECDDTPGKEFLRLFHPSGSEIVLDSNGSVRLKNSSDERLIMDAENHKFLIEAGNANTITMNTAGVRIEDSSGHVIEVGSEGIVLEAFKIILEGVKVHLGGTGGEKLINGETLLEMFDSHIHTSAPVVGGPSSKPVPQSFDLLSTTVKAK